MILIIVVANEVEQGMTGGGRLGDQSVSERQLGVDREVTGRGGDCGKLESTCPVHR